MEIPNEILNEVPKEEKLIEIGQDLSEEDLKNLRMFVREMVVQSIVPWVERAVVVGNEQVCCFFLFDHSFRHSDRRLCFFRLVYSFKTIYRWTTF